MRAAFEAACETSFGAQCCVTGVKAGSVVVGFTVVQYTATATGTSVVAKFADRAVVAAFGAAVAAATGLVVESTLAISSVTGVAVDGSIVGYGGLFDGAIAGIVISCVVVMALIVGGVAGVCTYRERRRRKQADGNAATPSPALVNTEPAAQTVAELAAAEATAEPVAAQAVAELAPARDT